MGHEQILAKHLIPIFRNVGLQNNSSCKILKKRPDYESKSAARRHITSLKVSHRHRYSTESEISVMRTAEVHQSYHA